MKVFMDENRHVDEFHLRLNSAHTHFKQIYQPLDPIEYSYPIKKPNTALIVFEDSHEIDMFIEMLNKFKEINYGYFGEWRPAHDRRNVPTEPIRF